MKTAILCFCLLFGSLLTAQVVPVDSTSDTASRDEVEKLFEAMQFRQQLPKVIESMTEQMRTAVEQTVKGRYPRITEAELNRLDSLYLDTMKDYPVNALIDDIIPVYQKYLSRADVEAMIVFYSSPTGKKLIDKMPEMTQEAMQVSYARMQAQMETMLDQMDKKMKQNEKVPGKEPAAKPKSRNGSTN